MFGQYDESYLQHFGHCSLDVVLRLTQSVFGSTGFHGAEKSVDNCFHWLHQIHCHWHCYDQIHSLLHHQKSKTDTLSYMHKMSQYTQEYIGMGIYQTRTVFRLLHYDWVNSLSESVILTLVLSSIFPLLGTIYVHRPQFRVQFHINSYLFLRNTGRMLRNAKRTRRATF